MKQQITAGLDIGSSALRLVVAQKTQDNTGERFQVIGAVETPTAGINKGVVTSIEDATSSISACLEKAERLIGVPIESAWIGINFPNLKCERSKGIVAVGKTDGEITEEDVERAIEAARSLSVPPNYEILHVIPSKFTVDSQEDIKDPIGMTGMRLEVEALIIQGLSSQIKNLTKAIYRTGLEIEDLVLSPLAAAEAVISPKQKELGAALINIGSTTTSIAVFEEGELLSAAVLPIGSEHITADIAIGLRCPINLADRIKVQIGSARSENFDKREEVDISGLVEEEGVNETYEPVSRKYISEIIEARVEEIFDKVDAEFKKIDRSGMLPAGVFLIGGGARLSNIVEVAKDKLRLPACLGTNKFAPTVIDKVSGVEFLTALGLVLWGEHSSRQEKSGRFPQMGKSLISAVAKGIKNIFKSIKP
jgi:cell division protein FtsA